MRFSFGLRTAQSMERLEKNIDFLKLVTKLTTKQRAAVFKQLTKEQIHVLAEMAVNVLGGNLDISDKDKYRMARYKSIIRRLGRRGVTSRARETVIQENPTAVSLLIEIVLNSLEDE